MVATKQIMQVSNFSGINQAVPHNLIEDNQCVFMGNMQVENGVLKKRYGYNLVHEASGETDISDLVLYNEEMFLLRKSSTDKLVVKKKGVKGDFETLPLPIEVEYTENQTFIPFNDELYLLTDLCLFKLTPFGFEKVEPYVPTILTTCSPEGSGQYLEDMNFLTNKCIIEYSIPSTIPDFIVLPEAVQMKDNVGNKVFLTYEKITCNDTELVVTTDFTMEAETGRPAKIVFTTTGKAKITKGTNNFIFHGFFKDSATVTPILQQRFRKISSCKVYTNYGGDNDTRILLSGNKDMKNCIFRSGVLDMTYFPENAFQLVGDSAEPITSFQKQYDCCLVFKSNSIWRMEFHITSSGVVDYPISPLNDNYGCDYMGASESIDNNAVFLNETLGLVRVFQSNQRGEANIGCISKSVNTFKINGFDFSVMDSVPELKKYQGLLPSIRYPDTKPSMADDGERLYIGCNKSIFVYDYKIKAWYVWNMQDKIINKVFIIDNVLYFISGNSLYSMKQEYQYPLSDKNNAIKLYSDREHPLAENQYVDKAIISMWISKQYDFNINERKKTVDRIFIEMQSLPRNSIDVYSINKEGKVELISEKINDLFGYNRVAYNRYGYNITPFPREMTIKYKAKKIGHFQFIFTNDLIDCASNVQSFDIRYKYNNYYK